MYVISKTIAIIIVFNSQCVGYHTELLASEGIGDAAGKTGCKPNCKKIKHLLL